MSQIEVTPEMIQCAFPQFANYPSAYLQGYICQAMAYISATNYRIRPQARVLAIEYMALHLMELSGVGPDGQAIAGATNGQIVTSATIDGVSVSTVAPIARDAYEQWIQSTKWGKLFWALMSANNPTPIFWVGKPCSPYGIR